MTRVSRAIQRLSGSVRVSFPTDPATDRAAGMVSLFNGDPDFTTPAWICDAGAAAIAAGYTHYQPVQGDPELRLAIAENLNRKHGQDYSPEDILITHGATGAIYASLAAVLDPGDEVVLLDPCYSLYEDAIRVTDGVPVRAKLRPDFHLDLDALVSAISSRCRMIVICNPCNPTTVVLSKAEMEAVEDLVVKHDLLLLADEVYDHIIYDGYQFTSAVDLPRLAERTLLVQSFSKTYAMTGWRIGFLASKNGLSRRAVDLQRSTLGAVNTMTQRAALAALCPPGQEDEVWFREMVGAYDRRRRMGLALLEQIPQVQCAVPMGTFYFWVKVESDLTSLELTRYLREEGRLAVHSGSEYGKGGEGYVRLSYAAPDEEVHEGITRMGEALARLDRTVAAR